MNFNSKERSYNLRSPAVKRILREAKELNESTKEYYARPLEDNLFEWHFTIAGADGTEFENGYYHGRILLPSEYPMKPPSIIMLTPNGRFELNKKICLSISGHHPETWLPSWSIRTVLLAIISFMPTKSNEGHIGALNYSSKERKILAKKSHVWKCQQCGLIKNHLKIKDLNRTTLATSSTTSSTSSSTTASSSSNQSSESIPNNLINQGQQGYLSELRFINEILRTFFISSILVLLIAIFLKYFIN